MVDAPVIGGSPRLLRELGLFAVSLMCGMTLVVGGVRAQEAERPEDLDREEAREVLELIREGKDFYNKGRFDIAYEKFLRAYETWPQPRILIRLGKTAEKLGRYGDAYRHFMAFLDSEPDDAEMAREAAGRVAALNEKHLGRVSVRSTPEGVKVYAGSAEGEPLGTTPTTIYFGAGEHRLVFVKPGFESKERTVSVDVDSSAELAVELKRSEGSETSPSVSAGDDSGGGGVSDDSGGGSMSSATGSGDAADSSGGDGFMKVLGWSTAISGAVGIAGGVGFSVLKREAEKDARDAAPGTSGYTPGSYADFRRRAKSRERASWIAFSAGGALTAVGLVTLGRLYLFKQGEAEPRAEVSVQLPVRRSGGGFGIQLGF